MESHWSTEVAEVKHRLFHTQSVARQHPKRTERLRLELPGQRYQWVSHMSQICQKISPILSNVRTLSIPMFNEPHQDIDCDRHWVDLLRVFNCVEELHLGGEFSYSSRMSYPLELMQTGDVVPALRQLSIDSRFSDMTRDHVVFSFIDARNRAPGLPAITLQRLE
jgi:hypothetical protein